MIRDHIVIENINGDLQIKLKEEQKLNEYIPPVFTEYLRSCDLHIQNPQKKDEEIQIVLGDDPSYGFFISTKNGALQIPRDITIEGLLKIVVKKINNVNLSKPKMHADIKYAKYYKKEPIVEPEYLENTTEHIKKYIENSYFWKNKDLSFSGFEAYKNKEFTGNFEWWVDKLQYDIMLNNQNLKEVSSKELVKKAINLKIFPQESW